MTSSKNDQIIVTACLEVFKFFEFVAVINYSLKNEFVFCKSACFVESDSVCSSSQGDLFGLAYEYFLFLKV